MRVYIPCLTAHIVKHSACIHKETLSKHCVCFLECLTLCVFELNDTSFKQWRVFESVLICVTHGYKIRDGGVLASDPLWGRSTIPIAMHDSLRCKACSVQPSHAAALLFLEYFHTGDFKRAGGQAQMDSAFQLSLWHACMMCLTWRAL